jgi:hypothetical protein
MSSQLEHSDALTAADALEAQGRYLDAIDVLTEGNRELRDPAIERRLVPLRHLAFDELVNAGVDAAPAEASAEEVPCRNGIPTVQPSELTAAKLRRAISTGGCLLVPGLVPEKRIDPLIEDIDRAIEGYDAHAGGTSVEKTIPWFEPFEPMERYRNGMIPGKREAVRAGGGAWTTDSPRGLFDLLEVFDETNLNEVVTGFLGERPVLSMNKCTLRRVPLDTLHAAWHQDGAFLGRPIRTLNVWIALTHCGDDAPGLDILPRRLDGIVQTGTEGSIFPWAVARDKVMEAAEGTPVCRPIFEPGDALLFDELFLHRTACEREMTRERYAIETWMFAPSVYPGKQVPLVV